MDDLIYRFAREALDNGADPKDVLGRTLAAIESYAQACEEDGERRPPAAHVETGDSPGELRCACCRAALTPDGTPEPVQ